MPLNTRVLKEPLGFIRLIEFPLAILAFATTAGYSMTTTVKYKCVVATPKNLTDEKDYAINWGYSFALSSIKVPADLCPALESPDGPWFSPFGSSPVSQSQFFVFTGVVCFFYILGILAIYLLAWPHYENDRRFSLADFVFTAILALFWFFASCAWASGVTTVKSETDLNTMRGRMNQTGQGLLPCNNTLKGTCDYDHHVNYASLNASLIAGFACFALWLANLWFIWKETGWYKARAAITTPAGQGIGGPSTSIPGNTFPGTTSSGPSPFR